jgi:lysyl-tRNA synthetase class 2
LRPPVLGVIVALVGAVGVVSALTPSLPRRLGLVEGIVDPEVVHLAAGTTALLGFVLLLLGRGIARRHHSALVAAVALLSVSAVTHLIKGLDVEETLLAAGAAVLLVRARRQFTVRAPAGRWRRVLRVTGVLLVADVVLGMVLMLVGAREHLRVPVKPGRALYDTVRLLGGAAGSAHFHGIGHLVPLALVLVGFGSAAAVLLVALAPLPDGGTTAVGGGRAGGEPSLRDLTDRADGDTLDPFARRADKRLVWSSDGRAAVAYRYVAGVGLASGDPVGDPASFRDAVTRFVAYCDARGWRPAFMGVRDDRLPLYEAAGLRAEYLGDEAIVAVDGFSLDGRAMRGVRQAVNRTVKAGITTEAVREGDLDDALHAALLDVAERGRDGAPERGFSMALDGLLSRRDADCLLVVARDADGRPFAFQRYAPCRAGRGLSLDAMRRDPDVDVPNGVNERLIVDTVAWAREHGVGEVSLNFAFCRALVDDDAAVTGPRRAQAWFVRRLSPWFQIESLLRFNAKFAPRWVPRHVVYRSLGDLPAVAAAAAGAEGFLPALPTPAHVWRSRVGVGAASRRPARNAA